jgi:hypothetical protein
MSCADVPAARRVGGYCCDGAEGLDVGICDKTVWTLEWRVGNWADGCGGVGKSDGRWAKEDAGGLRRIWVRIGVRYGRSGKMVVEDVSRHAR